MTKPEDLVATAEQIVEAVKKGHVETPRFKPEYLEDEKYLETLRTLCKKAVYSRWNREKKPSTLLMIYEFVDAEIKRRITLGQWRGEWTVPGKRTVDRRTNEAADKRFWVDEVTPIIALRAGLYCPNPYLFEDEVKEKIQALREDST